MIRPVAGIPGHFLAFGLSLVLHVGVVALSMVQWPFSKPLHIRLDQPVVYHVDLVTLAPPAPGRPGPVAPPRPAPPPTAEVKIPEQPTPRPAPQPAPPRPAPPPTAEVKIPEQPTPRPAPQPAPPRPAPQPTAEVKIPEQPKPRPAPQPAPPRPAPQPTAEVKIPEQPKPRPAPQPAPPRPAPAPPPSAPQPAPPKPAPAPPQKAEPTRDQILAEALGAARQDVARRSDEVAQVLAGLRQGVVSGTGGAEGAQGDVGAGSLDEVYGQMVGSLIRAHWRYPQVWTQLDLSAVVEIQLSADGRVLGSRMVRSSGRPDFDVSTKRAVEEAGQLPAPPRADLRTIRITFYPQEL